MVPLPRSVVPGNGTYALDAPLSVASDSLLMREAEPLARRIMRDHGAGGRVTIAANAPESAEGYRLTVDGSGIRIAASTPAGAFYALETLDQLLPARGEPLALGYVNVDDSPAFRWRGIHLDVSRHFFPIPVLKRYVDVAARYKLNVFHLHLDDDQGWRVEIKRYPRLTQIGSCRDATEAGGDATEFDVKRYCGYYTQSQLRDLVAYAAARYVTIVPEIEMPGHSQAAIAAYPRLSCDGRPVGVRETWGVSAHIYCPTGYGFTFLENVLDEILAIFPSRYIHIGGDEVPKNEWRGSPAVRALMQREHLRTLDAVQGYFDRRIERFLQSRGRRMIGWDEILDGGVTRDATIMSWRGEDGAIKAARAGNDTVLTPDGPLYFDAYQGDPNDEPQAIGNLSSAEDVYQFDPVPATLNAAEREHVIGVQGNVWTEYIADPDYLFYMLLPRMLSLSEIAWSDPHPRTWHAFESRTGSELNWLEAHGYRFRIPNPEFTVDGAQLRFSSVTSSVRTVRAYTPQAMVSVRISTPIPGATLHCTTDGTTPTRNSPACSGAMAVALDVNGKADVTAVTILADGRAGTPSELLLYREAAP